MADEGGDAFGEATAVGVDQDALGESASAWASNALPASVTVRFILGSAGEGNFARVRGARLKDGQWIVEERLPGNARRQFTWRVRRTPD